MSEAPTGRVHHVSAAEVEGSRQAPGPEATLRGHELHVRAITEHDERSVLALLRLTVGETSGSRKTEAFWRWKHLESPFGASYAVGAWDTERVELVGLRALMWWSFVGTDGTLRRGVRPVDTATHPDYQRRGIFSTLTRQAMADVREQGASFVFNTPNQNSLPGYLKMGWKVVARWPLYVRPVRWLRAVRRATRAGSARPSRPRPADLPSWAEFRNVQSDELAAMLASNERLRIRTGYRTVRDLSYMDWRYGAHPQVTYSVHAVRDARGLRGAVVGRTVPGARGLEAFLLTELVLRSPSVAEGAQVLREFMRASGSDYVLAHFAKKTFERAALLRGGFLRAPGRGYTFVAYPLADDAENATDPGSWDLSLGELEIF